MSKISAYTELTAVDPDDLFVVVDDPSGTPVTKKIKQKNIVPYGINNILFKMLTAAANGSNASTVQPWFPTAGGVAVTASTYYFFQGLLHISRSAGATSHTTSLLFGGTATLTAIDYLAECKEGDTNAIADWDTVFGHAATALQIKAASTSTTEQILAAVRGIVRVNAAGTFIPQFQFSAAPGGTPSIQPGTYFMLFPVGANASIGAWS
jgi:hypothetical protein